MTLSDLHEPLEPIFALLARWAGWPPGGRLLDVGCGAGLKTGVLVAALGGHSTIVGVDSDLSLVRTLAHRPPPIASRVAPLVADAHALPLNQMSFDGAWCCAVLGLLHDPALALSELRRALRPGGVAVVATAAQPWSAVHRWPPEVARTLAAVYEQALERGLATPHRSELAEGLAAQLRVAGLDDVAARAFLIEPPQPAPLVAELALTPWEALRPALAPLLDAATLAAADEHAAAPEDAEPVAALLAAQGRA